MYIYIKEMKSEDELIDSFNLSKWKRKITIKFKKKFNKITIKKIDNLHYLYIIPKVQNEKVIRNIIDKNRNKRIILSKDLKKYETSLDINKAYKIITYCICNVLQYIMDVLDTKIEMQNIYIVTNEYNEINIKIIEDLLNKVKNINIVTDNVKKYHNLEEKIYNKNGNLITVTNNKTRALQKANFIINLDYNNEEINKYRINRNAVIVNCSNEKLNILYFQGIIVNDIEIDFLKNEKYSILYNEFNKSDIYESFEIISNKYLDIIKKIQNDKVSIKCLQGNNGNIEKKELLNIKKYLDKL